MFSTRVKNKRPLQRTRPMVSSAAINGSTMQTSLGVVRGSADSVPGSQENVRLYRYEQAVKDSFSRIEPTLQAISALQHDADFVSNAQSIARKSLGFTLPDCLLMDSWIKPLDVGQIYAWCVFETFQRMSDTFFEEQPLMLEDVTDFQKFLQQCGFHTMDVSPCADGRLAHVISYVLRLPYKSVRRKSYAGALFDIEDSLQKWIETEMLRYREGRPNTADEPTRYLKVAAYHFSSVRPESEGCAAHGSDVARAAVAAKERLQAFRQGVENSFCCGASIDLLLIGVDTDTDAIRLHLPDAQGEIDSNNFIDAMDLWQSIGRKDSGNNEANILGFIKQYAQQLDVSLPAEGMIKLATRLLKGNLAQIDYVQQYHGGSYPDIGHQEKFIGIGVGFEEVQLRNLTFFSYLKTVEEASQDLDVGVKIFSGLNASRGLPIPVIIRYDYHGQVPGAKARAEARCWQLDEALRNRYQKYVSQGLLHTFLMVRDCQADAQAELVGCSVPMNKPEVH